jgi:hypothetical protein
MASDGVHERLWSSTVAPDSRIPGLTRVAFGNRSRSKPISLPDTMNPSAPKPFAAEVRSSRYASNSDAGRPVCSTKSDVSRLDRKETTRISGTCR